MTDVLAGRPVGGVLPGRPSIPGWPAWDGAHILSPPVLTAGWGPPPKTETMGMADLTRPAPPRATPLRIRAAAFRLRCLDACRSVPHRIAKWLVLRVVLPRLAFVPAARRHRIERRLRGREEARKLRLADHVVVSYGKSGRTWLRVLLSRFFQLRYGLDRAALLGFENLHLRDPRVPRILFTHDNYLRDYTGNLGSKRDYHGKRTVLMVRHPADVAVSQFFQWKYRMKVRKMGINRYPAGGTGIDIFDFVMAKETGLPRIIDFMNGWSRELEEIGDRLVLRYEDLHADAAGQLRRVLGFLGQDPDEAELADCVAFGGLENMRRLEAARAFRDEPDRMGARVPGEPASRKVRRGVPDGWRDHFDEDQAAAIEWLVEGHLLPGFGYLARERRWRERDRAGTRR